MTKDQTKEGGKIAKNQLTPMMQQYYALKEKCPHAIVFFRMGDFYEVFGADAEDVAPKLELVITSRERGDQQRVAFCGVPHHSAKPYWQKLIGLGYSVAIVDQMEDASTAKGLVRREIVRVLSPGCIDDLDTLAADSPNYLAAIYETPERGEWVACLAELSTGELRLGALPGIGEVLDFVRVWQPREVLARAFFIDALRDIIAQNGLTSIPLTALPEELLRDRRGQAEILTGQFACADLAGLGCGTVAGGEALLASVLMHFDRLKAPRAQFLGVCPLRETSEMNLDETAIRDLELFESTLRRSTDGTLFQELNATKTGMGARLLRSFMARPSVNRDVIAARLDNIRWLRTHMEAVAAARADLGRVPDVQRLSTRLVARSATPVELGKIRDGLTRATEVCRHLDVGDMAPVELRRALDSIKRAEGAAATINDCLEDCPGSLGQGRGVIRRGFDTKLAELVALADGGEEQVRTYEARLRTQTGIANLKIRRHQSFGLLVEVSKSNVGRVPAEFRRRQTMVNGERYTTNELAELERCLESATADAVAREKELYDQLVSEMQAHATAIVDAAQAVAFVDVFLSAAHIAESRGYVAPKLSPDQGLRLVRSRHPVVERSVGAHAFTANSLNLPDDERHLVITGPNMGGKSTVMRQVALIAVMHQMGFPVPAEEAVLPIFDRIFTRVGAGDDLARGRSTFMVEMAEAATILRQATTRSLVLLDEIGRGTSTGDGLAIAAAILEDLVARAACTTLFSTHFHQIAVFAAALPGVAVAQVEVLPESKDRLIFTHRLIPGASSSSYGIEVAQLAGVPGHVTRRAREIVAARETGSDLEHMFFPLRSSQETVYAPRRQRAHGLQTDPGEVRQGRLFGPDAMACHDSH